jgi:hypothetical protein
VKKEAKIICQLCGNEGTYRLTRIYPLKVRHTCEYCSDSFNIDLETFVREYPILDGNIRKPTHNTKIF